MKLLNFLHKIGNFIIRKTQRCLNMITIGPRAIVLNGQQKILLVKHTYQQHWYLPGGGIKKGESVKAALLRELKEEVGLTIIGELQLFGIYYHTYLGANDYPVIFIVKEFSVAETMSPEIEKMAWYAYDKLPENISPGTKRRIDEYFLQHAPSEKW